MSPSLRPCATVLIIIALAGLSACVTPGPKALSKAESEARWQARASKLQNLSQWELRGRVALSTASRGWSASLRWRRAAARQRIALSGPLGVGAVRVEENAQGAMLTDSKGNTMGDSSAEYLLRRATGWWLPVKGLDYWVRGTVAPGLVTKIELDGHGRLRKIEQHGWSIRFISYQKVAGRELPRKLFLNHTLADGNVLKVRLVISSWSGVK